MKNEIEQILDQAKKISKQLKVTPEVALLLIIAHQLTCLHDHTDKVIYGIIGAHAPKEKSRD